MRVSTLLLGLCTCLSAFAQTEETTITVFAQSLPSSAPQPLAEIIYDSQTSSASIASYTPPEAPSTPSLLRLGPYSTSNTAWISSTTATSTESFAKGYAPIFLLMLDHKHAILSVSVQSAKIDAGQTRDFGPKVRVIKSTPGRVVEVNKPIVLKEGKVEEEVPEKTLLQRYWWVGVVVLVTMVAGGGGEGK